MTGKTLSHYEILGEISRGGMGVVYRALDLNLGREVALKVLPADLLHDQDRRARLLQEARAAAALEHPHIGVIHEVGESNGVTFIAMEMIRGEKLSDVLSRAPLSQPRALALAAEIAEGLARAHEKGIIHRDLKPANIIVTDDGHAKIIDFGLAKLTEPVSQNAETASIHGPLTDAGIVLGTAAYMSPEQARGTRVDPRSDVFALGVTLYEMVSGRQAFQGQSTLDTMQAILTQPVPPVMPLPGVPAEATAELQRIIGKATAKDPDDRFQGMKDLVVDLRGARRRFEAVPLSGAVAPVSHPHSSAGRIPRARAKLFAGVIFAAIAAAAAAWWVFGRSSPQTIATPSGKPAVAALYFENNTGDPSLDWMRTGLTDMMVTDLSQSSGFETLGTDRLVQILQELKREDDRVLSADVVQEIAKRAGVGYVLVGSYVKSGGTIRINARLQEALTGRIVTAGRVEGPGESSLFAMVDDLTRRFVSKLTELGGVSAGPLLKRPSEPAPDAGMDRELTEVTTSSIEAYRYYAEGINFHDRGLPSQAAPLLEKAVEIDPNFAMAYAKLAVVHNNLVSLEKRDEYARRALSLTDRLTARERYYIEGFYYSLRPETVGRAIDAYQQGLRLHPEHYASRHNLGLLLMDLERYPEAIEHCQELVRRGTANPTTVENLTDMLIATGNVQRAREVADEFVARHPDSSGGLRTLGSTMVAQGHLDEARGAFEKSEVMDPLDFGSRLGIRAVALLQERWADAQAVNEAFARARAPFERFQSLTGEWFIASAHGKGQAARDLLERAARVPGVSPQQRAASRNRLAILLLRQHQPALAQAQAELALVDARNRDNEFLTLQLLSVAQSAIGRTEDSAKTLAQLEARAKVLPSEREVRRLHWTRGEIAALRGDTATAFSELSKASAMLPAFGPPLGPPSSHPDLLYATALAAVKAGRDAEAAQLLERIQTSHDHIYAPDPWARSFYLLGQVYDRRGDATRAREQYTHFLDLWRDGDLERGWVADAQKKVTR